MARQKFKMARLKCMFKWQDKIVRLNGKASEHFDEKTKVYV